jgi:hypothetical protein
MMVRSGAMMAVSRDATVDIAGVLLLGLLCVSQTGTTQVDMERGQDQQPCDVNNR